MFQWGERHFFRQAERQTNRQTEMEVPLETCNDGSAWLRHASLQIASGVCHRVFTQRISSITATAENYKISYTIYFRFFVNPKLSKLVFTKGFFILERFRAGHFTCKNTD